MTGIITSQHGVLAWKAWNAPTLPKQVSNSFILKDELGGRALG